MHLHNIGVGRFHLDRRLLGPSLTLVAAILVEVFSRTVVFIPAPGSVLVIPVVFAAVDGGLGPGMTSTAVALIYLIWSALLPGRISEYVVPLSIRLYIWVVALPVIVVTISLMKRRAEKIYIELLNTQRKFSDNLSAALKEYATTVDTLRESELRYRSVIEAMGEGVVLRDADGTLLHFNPSARHILGYSDRDPLPADLLATAIYEDGRSLEDENYPARPGKALHNVVLGLTRPDAQRVWITANIQPLFSPGEGQPYATVISFSDITERKQMETDLIRAREEALESARLKSSFLATMSHEIRTPINGMLGMVHILDEAALKTDQREAAQVIKRSGQSLLALMNDILDYAMLDAGTMTLENVDFELMAVVEEAVNLLAQPAHDKGLSLMSYVDPAIPPLLQGDPVRLHQILVNLVGNAVKFTGRGEVTVEVTLDSLGDNHALLRFQVHDTGIGLSESARLRLFQPFMQADDSTARQFGGTGLGLAICQRLVKLMHGTLEVESVEGQGSTFVALIPLRLSLIKPRLLPDSRAARSLSGSRMLVADDNPMNRWTIQMYLESWGVRCDAAGDGAEALTLIQHAATSGDPYDIAIVDLVMPVLDGIALARAIRSDPALKPTRLVLVTAYYKDERADTALDSDFAVHLTKPISQPSLWQALATLLHGVPTQLPPESRVLVPSAVHSGGQDLKHEVRPILLVEDNEVNLKVATILLERLGCTVEGVASGQEALDALIVKDYAIVFMDCQMPMMDGYDTARLIRQAEADGSRHVPIVALTANALQGDREACIAAGMDDYLSKPFTLDDLQRVVARWYPELPLQGVRGVVSQNKRGFSDMEEGLVPAPVALAPLAVKPGTPESEPPSLDLTILEGLRNLTRPG
ncbi:MAG TPA: response regulator, partial [Aggregatilineales bacterium]|nr:response regulator [Aggregatilineales bacterium]